LTGPAINLAANLLKGAGPDIVNATPAEMGTYIDYGIRLGANAVATTNAAVPLNTTQTVEVDNAAATENQIAFQSQSFGNRLFNTQDPDSLAGRLIDTRGSTIDQSMNNVASSFMHIGSSLANTFGSLFTSKARAAGSTYQYPFAEIGFSEEDQNNPLVQDPFANADAVAQLLDGPGYQSYHDKAEACFGVNLTKVTEDGHQLWDAIADKAVNPYDSSKYPNDCGDAGSNSDWLRIRFFIWDTSVMESYACYKLDDAQSCTNNGLEDSSTTPVVTTAPTGSNKQLAIQVLDLVTKKKISFENDSDLQNIEATSKGQPMTCTDEHGTVTLTDGISGTLLSVMIQLSESYDYRVSALFSGHGGSGNNGCSDGGRHPLGRAMDVDSINGNVISGDASTADSARYSGNTALDRSFITTTLQILPKGSFVNGVAVGMGGIGQQQCLSPRVSVPNGINSFNDLCNHVHIDVGARDK
jgi:hypothetical protein